jgi:hypothetical protein
MSVTRKLSWLAGSLTVLCLAVGSTASAQTAAKDRAPADETRVQVAGQTVAIDRATGRLRQPTPEERKALAAGLKAMLNHSTEGLAVVRRANGTRSVDLQGRFHSIAVAQVNSDGRVSEKCVTSRREAEALVKATGKTTRQAGSKKATTAAKASVQKGAVR